MNRFVFWILAALLGAAPAWSQTVTNGKWATSPDGSGSTTSVGNGGCAYYIWDNTVTADPPALQTGGCVALDMDDDVSSATNPSGAGGSAQIYRCSSSVGSTLRCKPERNAAADVVLDGSPDKSGIETLCPRWLWAARITSGAQKSVLQVCSKKE